MVAVGGLLWLLAAQAHANGLVALSGAIGLGVMAAVLLMPVVAVEALAYRKLLGVTWLRSGLAALLANVAGAAPMALGVLCLALLRWSWPYYSAETRAEALIAVACFVGLVPAKAAVVWLVNRESSTERPIGHVALWTSALTTALVVGVCMALYDLD